MPGKPQQSVTVNGSKLAGKLLEHSSGNGKEASLADIVTAEELHEFCSAVLNDHGAVTVSRTSDGGSLCWTLFLGDQRHKRYTPHRESWLELLDLAR